MYLPNSTLSTVASGTKLYIPRWHFKFDITKLIDIHSVWALNRFIYDLMFDYNNFLFKFTDVLSQYWIVYMKIYTVCGCSEVKVDKFLIFFIRFCSLYRWMNWLYKAQLDNQRTKLRLLKIKKKTKEKTVHK